MRVGDETPPGVPSFEGMSSSELIVRVQRGESRALDALLARYRPILRRWAAGRLPRQARDLVDTEDMVQEVLIGAVRNLPTFEPRHAGAFAAYVRQALGNRIRNEARRVDSRPDRAELPDDLPDLGRSPLDEAVGRDAVRRYESALQTLSPAEQEMVVARLEMGLGYEEIADAAGKSSADAARMTVTRALLRLAREMGRE